MTTKRIDQLNAHPRTTATPLVLRNNFIPVRDSSLGTDNTKKIPLEYRARYEANVLDFGAVQDDLAYDSTPAIQAAIDWVANNAVGNWWHYGVVYIPPGVYSIGQLVMREGVSLIGAGQRATVLQQRDGVNVSAIVQDQGSINNHYIHWCRIQDFTLEKVSGKTDTLGSGIFFNSNCGEGTKFQNLTISNFPENCLWVMGAIPCWFQDLHLFQSGQSSGFGYGLLLTHGGGNSWTGHYVLGISGDNHWNALLGVQEANCWVAGMKAETQFTMPYAIEMRGGSNNSWLIASGISYCATNQAGLAQAFVRIRPDSTSGPSIELTGCTTHAGAFAPLYLIKDDFNGVTVDYSPVDTHGVQQNFKTIYSGQLGTTIFKAHSAGGCWVRTAEDPPAKTGTFALGHTNGVGNSTSANMTALQKGTATNAPASLVVNKWVRASLDGVNGWIPFFT